jgi:hypothetical protein
LTSAPGVAPAHVVVPAGSSVGFQESSYQTPVLRGLPPVTWPSSPGNESEGTGVCAFVN